MSQPPAFGKALKEQEFYLSTDDVLLNNGSFGAAPKKVIEAKRQHELIMENHPDAWYINGNVRNEAYNTSLEKLANFVRAEKEDIVFVENATRGVNDALKSLKLQANDGILLNNFSYSSIKNIAKQQSETLGAIVHSLDIKFPIPTKEEIVRQYTEYMDAHPGIKVAIIDHISSIPSILFPLKELTTECRNRSIITIIDAAHGPNQVDLDVPSYEADFYIGNLYKWGLTCRGCAFLWTAQSHKERIFPVVTSNKYKEPYPGDFVWQGTREEGAFTAAFAAFDFIDWLGRAAIRDYTKSLGDWTVQELSSAWETEEIGLGEDLRAPCLRLVRIPDTKAFPKSIIGATLLGMALREDYKIRVRLFFLEQLVSVTVLINAITVNFVQLVIYLFIVS
ncbi:DgyrCDS13407 [Dimorphilus gyrociliatus]|uniref:DgyrCDS13407 n=1 Tax=Dimorphilus gyrociliatus TaxID=2664684 RepID=A0A7I8WAM7_9ANNE|nr:DgyrCDS13407 [Dimorphilus gyrociliatus]